MHVHSGLLEDRACQVNIIGLEDDLLNVFITDKRKTAHSFRSSGRQSFKSVMLGNDLIK